MLKRLSLLLLIVASVACEPFDLAKKNFPVCTKPTAGIGFTFDRLDVTFFLNNPQGDFNIAGWDPGDSKGKNRVGTRVTYNYEKAGTYTVTLILVNSCDDTFTTTRTITVTN